MKLTKPQAAALFIVLMAFFMSAAMSLVLTFIDQGFSSRLVSLWLKNWTISFFVATPVAWVTVPLVRRIVDAVSR